MTLAYRSCSTPTIRRFSERRSHASMSWRAMCSGCRWRSWRPIVFDMRLAGPSPLLIQRGQQPGGRIPLGADVGEVVVVRPDGDTKVKRKRQDVYIIGVSAANAPLGFSDAVLIH